MHRTDLGIYLAIPSRARPENVPKMQALLGDATWYLREEDAEAYKAAGAKSIVVGGNLIPRRNMILDDGFKLNLPTVQISDDIKSIHLAIDKKNKTELSFLGVIQLCAESCAELKVKLMGTAPTTNLFYYNPEKPIRRNAFCASTFLYVLPSRQRMDPEMSLKEDYDFNLQHLAQNGGWGRADCIIIDSPHHGNKGGCNIYRDPAEEQRNIAILKKRWSSMIRDNPKRPNEILLKV